ncbi:MAG: hypothetical protein QNJ62_01715 [Methyloceanibacter sp.]|nr:hypothetical protein [Methyloceanibacter sp.]
MNWTRMGAIALVIVGLTASPAPLNAEGKTSGEAASESGFSIEETWARVAPEMGKQLPMAVDDKTTWLTVRNDGPVLVSTFRRNLPKEEIVAAKDEMERSAIQNTCRGTQRGKELLDAGGVVRQVFYDQADQLAVTIDVDSKSCNQD